MTTFDDTLTSSFTLPGATTYERLRARKTINPYNPNQYSDDWDTPDSLTFTGALAASSSSRNAVEGYNLTTTSTAILTVADPHVDIIAGDRIRAVPDDGRMWEVTGVPSKDVNAFTGWQPTTEITLTEWKG